ncbi:MAG: R3H domain-containing nucleic acid-binding protein [bacterium]
MDKVKERTFVAAQLNEKNVQIVKSVVTELLSAMGITGEIFTRIQTDDDGREMLALNIKSTESRFLIGHNGSNLQALQHLARLLLKNKSEEIIYFILDVNDYRQAREQHLQRLAYEFAKKVKTTGEKVVLKPLPAGERRIIHMTLAEDEEIMTESVGLDTERRLVIKPKK